MTTQSPEPKARRVLLVEDDPDDARVVYHAIGNLPGLKLVHVRTGGEAMDALNIPADVCLVDQRLPDINGVELITKIRASGHQGEIIMVSGVREDIIVGRAFEAGADDFIVKDLDYGLEVCDRLGMETI